MGGGGCGWGAEGDHLDSNNSAVPFSIGHKLIQSICTAAGWAKTAIRSSLVYSAVQLHCKCCARDCGLTEVCVYCVLNLYVHD